MIGVFALLLLFISPSFCGNLGIGFSTNGPFDVPLAQMKAKNVYIFKTWDIQPDLLDQMAITYAKVKFNFLIIIFSAYIRVVSRFAYKSNYPMLKRLKKRNFETQIYYPSISLIEKIFVDEIDFIRKFGRAIFETLV